MNQDDFIKKLKSETEKMDDVTRESRNLILSRIPEFTTEDWAVFRAEGDLLLNREDVKILARLNRIDKKTLAELLAKYRKKTHYARSIGN